MFYVSIPGVTTQLITLLLLIIVYSMYHVFLHSFVIFHNFKVFLKIQP